MDLKPYIQRAREAYERSAEFLAQDIWDIGKPGEAIPSGFLIKQLRVGILLFRGLFEEALFLRASALTFTTLLFLVPFLVFMFSFIQTFSLGDQVYGRVSDWIDVHITQVVQVVKGADEEKSDDTLEGDGTVEAGPEDVVEPPAEAAGLESQPAILLQPEGTTAAPSDTEEDNKKLANDILRTMFPTTATNGDDELFDPVQFLVGMVEDKATDVRTLGLTGLMYVLITVLGLMRNVEWAFNQIWGVTETRKLVRTLSDYIMITLLLPVVAAVMLGITAALTTNDSLGHLSILLRGSQVLIISLTFSLLYYFVPNTSVQPRCALLGGLIAGIAWTLTAWAYVTFNVGMARYTFFFSAFALVPMLLAWIYTSWIILLFGALVTFAYQNEKTFALERLAAKASIAYREAVALRVMIELARRFAQGAPARTVLELAEAWNVPSRLINEALETLKGAGLVTECATEPATYQPGKAADKIQVVDVINALREEGESPSALREEEPYRAVYDGLTNATTKFRAASIADLAAREA